MRVSIARFAMIAFISGACVMVLEMVGARMLAPYLGTGIVVWTSLIGIILASLSVGYWLGGRLADRTVSETVLAGLLIAAAASILLTAVIHTPVLQWAALLNDPHTAAVLAACSLFALPAVFCGMISPYVVRLALSEVSTAGATIGTLNAVSTAGSILGTFLGGFVLIAWFASPTIIYGIALIMAATALITRGGATLPALAALVLIGGAGLLTLKEAPLTSAGLIHFQETPYNAIQVKQGLLESGRSVRVLITGQDRVQSRSFVDAPYELASEYAQFYQLATALKPQARRVLMLGGGGYSVPKWLFGPLSPLKAGSFNLDVVEIDPGVTEAAERFLGLNRKGHPQMNIVHEDARIFVNRIAARNGPKYDLVMGDVFNSVTAVPFHLATQEAARSIYQSLNDDGVLMMNIIAAQSGDNGRLFRAIHGAFASVFPMTEIFLVQDPQSPAMVQNIMLLASRKPVDLAALAARSPELAPLLAHRSLQVMPTDVPILTDNYAPVERYALDM